VFREVFEAGLIVGIGCRGRARFRDGPCSSGDGWRGSGGGRAAGRFRGRAVGFARRPRAEVMQRRDSGGRRREVGVGQNLWMASHGRELAGDSLKGHGPGGRRRGHVAGAMAIVVAIAVC